jgi:hypothetical protein
MPEPMIIVSTMLGACEVQILNLLIHTNSKKNQADIKLEKHWLDLLLNKRTCRALLCGFMQKPCKAKREKHV